MFAAVFSLVVSAVLHAVEPIWARQDGLVEHVAAYLVSAVRTALIATVSYYNLHVGNEGTNIDQTATVFV